MRMVNHFLLTVVLYFLASLSLSAQGLNMNVAVKYQISPPGSTGTSPNFTVSGFVGDELSRWDALSVAIGDSLYVLDGPNLHVFVVAGINSAGGYALNMNVTAIDNDLSQIPSGQATIIRPTVNRKLPTYVAGLRDDLRSAIMNRLSILLDVGGGAADGNTTAVNYDGTNLTLTRTIGGNISTVIREVVNTSVNPSGAPGTGEKIWVNSTTGNIWYASGVVWVPLPSAQWTEEFFASQTGTVINTTGPLPVTNTQNRIIIFRTGVKLREGVDYTLSGNTITLILAAQSESFTVRWK